MGYNRENYRRIKREYDGKNLKAKELAESKRRELHLRFPGIKAIDDELDQTGLRIFCASVERKGDALEKEIDRLQKENADLLEKRAQILTENNYPADYSDVKYECEKCSDTGFVGLSMCECMKKKLILAGYESSGIGGLIGQKTFENFDVKYQSHDKTAYENIKAVYNFCRKYADGFDTENARNLLFIGATGLGKTHISTAICGKVIDNGFDCVYETAQNMFSDFEHDRFDRPYGSGEGYESHTDRYFDCDLLIIDDLGTELTNQFTVSCLYNIINTRLNRGKPMIINTNLTRDMLNKRYSDRITSRLFGEFYPLIFMGRDVREQKLGEN